MCIQTFAQSIYWPGYHKHCPQNSPLHKSSKFPPSLLLVIQHKSSSIQQQFTSLWSKAAIPSLAAAVVEDAGGSTSWMTTGLSYETESCNTNQNLILKLITLFSHVHNKQDSAMWDLSFSQWYWLRLARSQTDNDYSPSDTAKSTYLL